MHVEESHTNTTGSVTRTETTTTDSVDCPVTPTTSSFGVMTSDGRYIRFDPASNTRVTEIVKTNKSWSRNLQDRRPITVRVVGSPDGDTLVVDSIR